MDERTITYYRGFFFPIGGLLFGGFLSVISLAIIFTSGTLIYVCIGITVLCVGLMFFSTNGFEINLTTGKVRDYTKILGLKNGKTIPLDNFKYLAIINQTYSRSSFSRSSVEFKSSFGTYNLLLLNETHHLKQLVDSFGTYDSALAAAKQLSEQVNFEIVTFKPVQTRKRK